MRQRPITQALLLATVLSSALGACADEPKESKDPGLIIIEDVDQGADMHTTSPEDMGKDSPEDMTSPPPEEDMTPEDMGMSQDMGPVAQGFSAQTFFNVALDLIPGASLRVPIKLEELQTDIELMVVRELRGFDEVQNKESGAVILKVNDAPFVGPEAGMDQGPLPMGSYDVFLENHGGCSGTACNDFILVKVISTPKAPAAEATFKGIVAQQGELLSHRSGEFIPFTVKPGHRYVARGIRGKNYMVVIAESERAKVEANQTFSAYYRWDQTIGEDGPDPQELDKLPPGNYYVLMVNNAADERAHGSVIRIDEWASR